MKIFFDMDGTIADFYNVKGWLDYILASDPYPYQKASSMVEISYFTKMVKKLQQNGIKVCILSWLAKNSTKEYDEAVTAAKTMWLKETFQIDFNEIYIIPYGSPKYEYCVSEVDILFDDEEKNREEWTGKAYPPEKIFEVLQNIA